jgi:ATP-dependent Lon protease
VAIAAALISLFRDEPIRRDLAMTGELTLTGRVLPVGGVKEKVLGARRAGIKSVLLPSYNEKDLTDLPEEVKNDLTFRGVESLDDVVDVLFTKPSRRPSRPKSGSSRAGRSSEAKGKGVPGRPSH